MTSNFDRESILKTTRLFHDPGDIIEMRILNAGQYKTISGYFNDPGVDIANATGTPDIAADSGSVIYAGWDATGYGNMVLIDHGNGYHPRALPPS